MFPRGVKVINELLPMCRLCHSEQIITLAVIGICCGGVWMNLAGDPAVLADSFSCSSRLARTVRDLAFPISLIGTFCFCECLGSRSNQLTPGGCAP